MQSSTPIPVQVSRRAGETLALKVQNPGSTWEFYISRVLQGRLPEELHAGFGCPQQLLMLEGGAAALLMPLGAHGNLQDRLNAHLSQGNVGHAGRVSPAASKCQYACTLPPLTASIGSPRAQKSSSCIA